MKTAICVRLNEEKLKQFRLLMIELGILNQSELIEKLIKQWIEDNEEQLKK